MEAAVQNVLMDFSPQEICVKPVKTIVTTVQIQKNVWNANMALD